MADTSVKLSGTYDSIEAYNIMVEMQNMSADYEEIRTEASAAASAATAASAAATNAVNTANTAVANAQTYAGNANTSAGEAAGYASDASTSATNAASSETNAHNSEVAAAASASDAADSASAAAASEAVVNGALPLSGGTMTGSIYNGVGTIIRRSDNTGFTQINAGADDTSSYISMYGKSHTDSAGVINLRAINSTNDKRLQLNPNGSMTWGGVSLTDGTLLTAKTTTVSARSGTSSYSITAPSASGYQFICWVMSASNGNVYPTYIANATSSSATVWAINPTNNTSIVCTALYVRKW